MVIRTPISNPSLRSIHISYANLQVEPRQAEASGSEIVCYVEASARSGAKGDKFGAEWTRAKLWRAGGFLAREVSKFLRTQENQPLFSPPQPETQQSPQAIDQRIDPSGIR